MSGELTHDENTSIWWVTSISSIAAPTTSELAAGTNISTFVPKDGLKLNASNDAVPNGNITTAAKLELAGSYGYKPVITIIRKSTDTAYTALKTRKTAGYIVVRRMVPFTTAAAAAQKVEVYPVQTGAVKPLDTAENERVKVDIEFFLTDTPNLDATLA